VEWVVREYGPNFAIERHRALPTHLASLVDPTEAGWGIVISSWYPDELVNRLLELFLDPFAAEERSRVLEQGTEYARDRTYRGIYKHAIQVILSPERCAHNIARIWRLHYDSGHVTWRYTPGRVESHLVGWRGHHPYRCEINRVSEKLTLEMLGCQNVETTLVKCIDRGDDGCGCISVWRK
jgi:hypothetical protein